MSCVFVFESSNYISLVSNLQQYKIIQNETVWPFKVSLLDATHTQSKKYSQFLVIQLEESARRGQENQKQVINLQEGDNQYFVYDQNIIIGHTVGKLALTIIRSSNELMRMLDSINGLETKSKKEVRGKGICFRHSDFIVKIGEFKKFAKTIVIILVYFNLKKVFYKPFEIIPTDCIQETYADYYTAYMTQLLSLINIRDFDNFESQIKLQKDFLNMYMKEWQDQDREAIKDPTRKELREKEQLASHKYI